MREFFVFSITIFFTMGNIAFGGRKAPPPTEYCCEESGTSVCITLDSKKNREAFNECHKKSHTGKITIFAKAPSGEQTELTKYNCGNNDKLCNHLKKDARYENYDAIQKDKENKLAAKLEKCKSKNSHAVLNSKGECSRPDEYFAGNAWDEKEVAREAEEENREAKEKDKNKTQQEEEANKRTCESKRYHEFVNGTCKELNAITQSRTDCKNRTPPHTWNETNKTCIPKSQAELSGEVLNQRKDALTLAEERSKNINEIIKDSKSYIKELEDAKKDKETIESYERKKAKLPSNEDYYGDEDIGPSLANKFPNRPRETTISPTPQVNMSVQETQEYTEALARQNARDEKYGKKFFSSTSSGDAIKTAEADVKNAKQEAKNAEKTYDRDSMISDNANDLRQKNVNRKYGGMYGGLSAESTQKLNQAITQGVQVANSFNTQLMQSKGSSEIRNHQSGTQGAQETEGKMLSHASTALKSQSAVESIATLTQAYQATRHLISKGRVTKAKIEAEGSIRREIKAHEAAIAALQPGSQEIQDHRYAIQKLRDEDQKYVSINSKGEKDQQNELSLIQGVASAITGIGARTKMVAARQTEEMAKQLQNPNYYGLNLGGGIVNPGSVDPALAPTPTSDAVVDAASLEDTAGTGEIPLIDGNPANDLKNPLPSVNLAMGQQPSAGNGGGGAGSAGGTSKAQDESSGGQAPVKDPKAGSYASSEGGGAGKYSSRGSASQGENDVKMDSAFADLLKKFLPTAEDKKEAPSLDVSAQSDRSPASDRAAVIGRNKNIFDEIHKRYQKKNAEGAILF